MPRKSIEELQNHFEDMKDACQRVSHRVEQMNNTCDYLIGKLEALKDELETKP